jgi:hypothetical protein
LRIIRNIKRTPGVGYVAVMGAAVAVGVLAGCSSVTPSIGQYAIVTGHGAFSNQQVLDVVTPGGHIKVNGGTAWYLPAQYRNYVTAPSNGDRNNPQAVLTGPDKSEPGMSVKVWTWVGFELNPAIDRDIHGKTDLAFATKFFPFCFKYSCASLTAQNNDATASQRRFSSSGWEGMLNEVFPHAIDNATQDAVKAFGPTLWSDKAAYTALARGIQANLDAELHAMDNAPLAMPFFCGPGSTETHCTPPLVLVNNVTPTDPAVVTAYNQQISATYAQQAGQERLSAARATYGDADAGWFLGMQDLINTCHQDDVTCNIYVGNAPVAPSK